MHIVGQAKKHIINASADNGAYQAINEDIDQMVGIFSPVFDAQISN